MRVLKQQQQQKKEFINIIVIVKTQYWPYFQTGLKEKKTMQEHLSPCSSVYVYI